jgi:hypothetical protein
LRLVGILFFSSLLLLGALLSFHHGLNFEFKVFSLLLGFVSLMGQDLLNDLLDLSLHIGLFGVTVNHLHECTILFFNSETLEPAGESILLLIKRYKTIHQGRDGVVFTNLLGKAFAKGSLIDWRLDIFNVEHEGLLVLISVIEVTAISSA